MISLVFASGAAANAQGTGSRGRPGRASYVPGYREPSNAQVVAEMFFEWDQGVGPADRLFVDDKVAGAFRDAWRVGEAREYFYTKYSDTADLTDASVTDYSGKFGLEGLFRAGFDPVEQFVGSYNIDIFAVDQGQTLQFNITNTTSMRSFLYGIGPDWERSTFPLNGNTRQTYIFTEPVREDR